MVYYCPVSCENTSGHRVLTGENGAFMEECAITFEEFNV